MTSVGVMASIKERGLEEGPNRNIKNETLPNQI